MRVRVTERLGQGLCATCREAQIVEHDDGVTVTRCHAHGVSSGFTVRRPVVRCSDHTSRLQLTKWEMEKAAWILERKGNRIGFVRPTKTKDGPDPLDAATDLATQL